MTSEARLPENAAIRKLWDKVEVCAADRRQEHGELKQAFETHLVKQHHPPLDELASEYDMTPAAMIEGFMRSVGTTERIVTALEGPKVKHLDGTVGPERVKSEGVNARLTRIEATINNGIKTKLTTGQKVAIYVAAISAFGTVIVAIIGTAGG